MQIGCVFPGQGSQIAGMGQDLYSSFSLARELYDQASSILGYDLLKACENKDGELNDTRVAQPAIFVQSVVCYHLLQQMTEKPVIAMAGHSLGEFSAVVCAGGLPFKAAVSLVKLRAELMSACEPDGSMMVVFGLSREPLMKVCEDLSAPGKYVTIANQNAAEQWVLSGHRKALQEAATRLEQLDGIVKQLNVSIPAHCALMTPARAPFEQAIRQAQPADCRIPVISCISGKAYTTAEELAPMLSSQLTGCVNWPLTVSQLLDQGIDTLIELGPKTVLRDLIRLEFPHVCAISFGTDEGQTSVRRLLEAEEQRARSFTTGLPGLQVEAFLQACLRLAIGTPSYKTHSPASFRQTIQAPYHTIVESLDVVRASSDKQANLEILRQATRSTLGLLRAKGLDVTQCHSLLEREATRLGVRDAIIEYVL